MKILEISPFSSGMCGVGSRVQKESELLVKKEHQVYVYSSNIKRGSERIEFAPEFEENSGVKIRRFKTFGHFGQNTFFWDYEKEALKLKPDIIITHAYRQYYSTKALKVAKKLKIPCILVTHAPFLDKKLRGWKLNLAVFLYDNLVGKKIINKYSKVIAITNWEIPNLLEMGCKKEKIVVIPNGLPKEFFNTKLKTPKNKRKKVLFMGRIAPIKNLETLIRAVKGLDLILKIVGPAEKGYKERLLRLLEEEEIKNVKILDMPYNRKQQISLLDAHDIYVLPSLREGMPQTLIEAMSRGKLVISSTNDGGREIIKHKKNGLIFEIKDVKHLRELLKWAINKKNSKQVKEISKNAQSSIKQYSWEILIAKLEKIILTSKSL